MISETEFGAVGEIEKLKAQAQVEFERIQRETIEIGSRLKELEKMDRTTGERTGDPVQTRVCIIF